MSLFVVIRKKQVFLLGIGLLLASGCAHLPPSTPNESQDTHAQKVLTGEPKGDSLNSLAVDHGDIVVRGVKLKNSNFDIPISINSRVEYWIDYFCGRGREYFSKYLERSEFFIPYISPLLKQNSMPQDLVYLAMIESGFNNLARSRARAVGPWQFISATGRRYGLLVNWWIDERRDIRKSTLAAVEYLKDLYSLFRSWELAAAAYNAGEAKIARAIRQFGSKDFWVIARHRFLRPETRDYVPKIMAAAIIAKNRAQFGFDVKEVAPTAGEVVAGDGEVVKLVTADKAEAEAEEKEVPTAFKEYSEEKEMDREIGVTPVSLVNVGSPSVPLAKPVPTPHVTKKGEVGGEELAEFDVRSPADLLKVATAAGLSYQTVKSLNPEILRWCTPPTLGTYRIKLPASIKDKFLETYNHEAFPKQVQFLAYKVHRGETLTRIARHFGIKVDPMSDLNGVSAKAPLRSGVKVLLPMPSDRTRNYASLEVQDPPERRRRRHRHSHRHSRTYKVTYKREATRPASAPLLSRKSPLES